MWASTYNDTLKQKMTALVSALSECQQEMGTGYLSAFPSEQFDRFEAIKPVWAPYYTIHKVESTLIVSLIVFPEHFMQLAINCLVIYKKKAIYCLDRSWQAFWINIHLLVMLKL